MYDKYRAGRGRQMLCALVKNKVDSTMKGSLEAVEKHLGHLWENDKEYADLYRKIRSHILDTGNDNIRNFERDVCNYEITYISSGGLPVNKGNSHE